MTLHSRCLFTLWSHLDHVSILAAEFTVTISDNNTVHSTKDCIADTRCASLFIYLFYLHHTHNNGIHLHKLYKK